MHRTKDQPRFADVFSRSTLAPNSHFLKRTRRIYRQRADGLQHVPTNWVRLIQLCRRLELPCEELEFSSPINPTLIYRSFPFLDGGVVSREGDYFFGPKGTWVIGRLALRFICYELGIKQRRRFTGETGIPSHRHLVAHIAWQADEAPEEVEALSKALARFR